MTTSTQKQMPVLNDELCAYIDQVVAERVSRAQEMMWPACACETNHRGGPLKELANRATLVVFSGEMDKVMAALVIASGAASMGMEVSLFFTFWGLTALKKKTVYQGKPLTEKLLSAMLPKGIDQLGPSKMSMLGAGRSLFKRMMKEKHVQSPGELLQLVQELGVRLIACQMSMDVMGMVPEEMIDSVEFGGVATYMADARDSRVTLFI